MKEQEFYKQINSWLVLLGYEEIYSNHPSSAIREWHFIKNNIRVVCVKSYGDKQYCYLYCDVLQLKQTLSFQTNKFEIGTNKIEELQKFMEEIKTKLIN